MKTLISVIALMLISFSVFAENIVEVPRGGTPARIYIDLDSIIRSGDEVQFWYILDIYVARRGENIRVYGNQKLLPLKDYKSNKVEVIFDCRRRKSAAIRIKAYEHAAGKGEQTGSYVIPPENRKWRDIIDGGTLDQLYPYVCHV